MTTFKEIDINEHKKLLDNMQKLLIILNYYIISKKM